VNLYNKNINPSVQDNAPRIAVIEKILNYINSNDTDKKKIFLQKNYKKNITNCIQPIIMM